MRVESTRNAGLRRMDCVLNIASRASACIICRDAFDSKGKITRGFNFSWWGANNGPVGPFYVFRGCWKKTFKINDESRASACISMHQMQCPRAQNHITRYLPPFRGGYVMWTPG